MEQKKKNKWPKKFFGIVFANLLFCLINFGCASTGTPPDVPVCVEFSPVHGRCVKIISQENFFVDEENLFENKTWWQMRPTFVLVPASSWAQIKSYIVKVCKKYDICEKELGSWDRTLNAVDENLKRKTTE